MINFASKTRGSSYHSKRASEQNDVQAFSKRVLDDPSVVQKRDPFGYTPLHFAAQQNNVRIVELLLEGNAEVDASDCGATPLHRAAYAGCFESCKLLLEAGADPNRVDTSFQDQRTALHKAASNGHEQVMSLLEAYGGNNEKTDAWGLTPAEVLKQFQQQQLTPTLLASSSLSPVEMEAPRTLHDDKTKVEVEAEATSVDSVCDSSPAPTSASATTNTTTRSSVSAAGVSVNGSENNHGAPSLTAGTCCPVCGNKSLLFTRFLRGGLVCLDCYSKR